MTAAAAPTISAPGPATSPEAAPRPPAPRPLLVPTLAFAAGIWAGTLAVETPRAVQLAVLVLALAAATGAFAATLSPRTQNLAVLPLLLAFALSGFLRAQADQHRPANHVSQLLPGHAPLLTRITGEVISAPLCRPAELRNPFIPFEPAPRSHFVMAARELRTTAQPVPIRGHIRVGVDGETPRYELGQQLEITGRLYRPLSPRNPGETDWAHWSYLSAIDAGLAVDDPGYIRRLPGSPGVPSRAISWLRRTAEALLLEEYAGAEDPEAAGLLNTLVLGQRAAASRAVNEAFRRAGGLHYLAVSGFHVLVIGGLGLYVGRALAGRVGAYIVMLAVVALYALLAEPNAPILRAVIAGVLAALAAFTRRPICILNWLALAALLILACNPRELFRPGFQLSFMQVLALITLVPPAFRAIMRLRRAEADDPPREADRLSRYLWLRAKGLVVGAALVSVVAWAMSLPAVWFHFGQIAPWGALGSLVLALPVTAVTAVSFLNLLCGYLFRPAAELLLGPLQGTLVDFLLRVVRWFDGLPGAVVELHRPPLALVLATYAALFWLMLIRLCSVPPARCIPSLGRVGPPHSGQWLKHPRACDRTPVLRRLLMLLEQLLRLIPTSRAFRLSIQLAPPAVLLGFWIAWAWPRPAPPGWTLTILAVGNGNAVILSSADAPAYIFDAGTDRNSDAGETVAQALRAAGVRAIDMICISHANFDHYSGVPTLATALPPRRIAWNTQLARRETGQSTRPHGGVERLASALRGIGFTLEALAAGDEFSVAGESHFARPGDLQSGAYDLRTGANNLRSGGSIPPPLDAKVQVLWPPADLPVDWKENDRALVLRLEMAGRVILLPGDVERQALAALLAADAAGEISLAADILVAPHHGSVLARETAAFLAAANPELVIISAAGPRPRFAALLNESLGPACKLLNTGEAGAVTVQIRPDGGLYVKTPFAPAPAPQ